MFKAGDAITVTGSPDRHDPNTCYLGTTTFADGSSIDRYGQRQPRPVRRAAVGNDRPARLANGDPNIDGDWAGEQRVMTDPRGQNGTLVPLSAAQDLRSGRRAGRRAGVPGRARHRRVARRRSRRHVLEQARQRSCRSRTRARPRSKDSILDGRQSAPALRADEHLVRLDVRDGHQSDHAERDRDQDALRLDGHRAHDPSRSDASIRRASSRASRVTRSAAGRTTC